MEGTIVTEGWPVGSIRISSADGTVEIEELASIWDFLDVKIRRGESRGDLHAIVEFVLQTDWAVVRDTLVAAALARGASDVRSALVAGARHLKSAFAGSVAKAKVDLVVIEDSKSDLRLSISASAAASEDPWLALLAGDLAGPLTWDEESAQWRKSKDGA